MILDIISFSCPLLLAAAGALFSEYAGVLALYLEGLISFSGFLTYLFTNLTGSLFSGILLACISAAAVTFFFSFIIEKLKANAFIAGIGINLLLSAAVSLISSLVFHTRGVLSSSVYCFSSMQVKVISIIFTFAMITAAICFLKFTQKGIYFRITGSDPDVLLVRGINPAVYRIASWMICGLFAAFAGTILSLRISSYVPNLSSGKGWMALAAVFLGKKNLWRIALAVIVFCGADFFSSNLQGLFPAIPGSVLLALPYIVVLIMITFDRNKKN